FLDGFDPAMSIDDSISIVPGDDLDRVQLTALLKAPQQELAIAGKPELERLVAVVEIGELDRLKGDGTILLPRLQAHGLDREVLYHGDLHLAGDRSGDRLRRSAPGR